MPGVGRVTRLLGKLGPNQSEVRLNLLRDICKHVTCSWLVARESQGDKLMSFHPARPGSSSARCFLPGSQTFLCLEYTHDGHVVSALISNKRRGFDQESLVQPVEIIMASVRKLSIRGEDPLHIIGFCPTLFVYILFTSCMTSANRL